MNAQEIRKAYLDFLVSKKHVVIPRALLVPQGESGVLFTGSGMQPLIPFLLGEDHPKGTRLTDSQTCLRAQDIEEVGDNSHTTFFEMLGNWSLGDYFKEEQLPWFFEFLTDIVGLDPKKLYVTAFAGDEEFNIPKDEVSADIWVKLFTDKGIEAKVAELGDADAGAKRGMNQGERVFYYDASENWWAPEGEPSNMSVGQPGGPDSEVFYVFEDVKHDESFGKNCHPGCDCGRFMEIGNSVFMEYLRTKDGFEKLPKQNVDFGGGLERIAAAKLDSPDVFKISILWPIIEKLQEISGHKYEEKTEDMRVIADHLRGAMFLAVDGVAPSNKEQGYVMRRLMRRAILRAFDLGVEQNFVPEVVPVIADLYRNDFPELKQKEDEVIATMVKEEKVFKQTLRKGRKELHIIVQTMDNLKKSVESGGTVVEPAKDKNKILDIKPVIEGQHAFKLFDTYGFPLELTIEEAESMGISLSDTFQEDFAAEMKQQRERSQTAAKGSFKGGLGGQTMQHKKYHTATHLLYQALRDVLGDHIIQHGSNITEERLRFDFSHGEKMTEEEIKATEDIVNEQIKKDLTVTWKEYPTEEATGPLGALGQFGDRYGDTVKVYNMQADGEEKPFSFEICGGPHVDHTAQLAEGEKVFKITKEQSSSAGIRRIKAVLQ